MEDAKHCPKCGHDKPRTEFHVDRSHSDGLSSNCVECRRAASKTPKARNRPSETRKWPDWTFRNLKLNGRDY